MKESPLMVLCSPAHRRRSGFQGKARVCAREKGARTERVTLIFHNLENVRAVNVVRVRQQPVVHLPARDE